MEAVPHQESELVCILADCKDMDSDRPVIVQVRQIVGEPLQVLRLQPQGVPHHIVAVRVHQDLVD